MGWALDQDLPPRPKLVLVSIGNHANATDGYCWLKAETIAAESSCSVRSVYRTLAALVRNGYLRRAPRKGADGKQRANDYWILFNREATAWEWRVGSAEDDEDDTDGIDLSDAETHGSEATDPQDVVAEDIHNEHVLAHGPYATASTSEPRSEHVLAHGPTAIGGTAKDSSEPSKTNPEKAAGVSQRVPRGYRPEPQPPPPPMGSTTAQGAGAFIFVFADTPAYRAWKAVKERELKRPWNQRTTKDGRWGWYFPTLFPPNTHDPPSEMMTADDIKEAANMR